MRIYIHSAPEDLATAQRLADLVAQQPNIAPDSPITVAAPADAVSAQRLIDENTMIVFLFSLKMYDLGDSYMSWLADLVEYALRAADPAGAKLVVDFRLDRVIVPEDSRLAEALSYTRVQHSSRSFSSEPLEEKLQGFAQTIAEYSTWKFYQNRDRRGFAPEDRLPALTREPKEDEGGFDWSPIEQERGPEMPSEPPPLAQTPPAGQAGEDFGGDGIEQERGLDWDAPAATPSAPQPPASQPAAPPPGVVGGLPMEEEPVGGVIPSPAPYPEQDQQQDERKEAPRQRGEAAPSSGLSGVDASTLQFSAYHPNTVAVSEWQTLIVYTYLAEALAQIQADAATFTELGSAPTVAKGQASRQVEKGVELTVEPHMEGVTFSPERETFIWRGDWRRTLFRFSGAADLAGREQRGWIDIYAGPMVPVARIDLTFPFHDDHGRQLAVRPPRGMIVSSNIYDAVFISYSHHDGEAFRQACDEYNRFGVTVYTDEQLEAGAQYEQVLSQRIAEANVFHLLWSPHSATSVECHKEWMAALQREPSERFIKPWFWRKPLSAPPAEFVAHHISFKYEPLRRSLWRPSTWFA